VKEASIDFDIRVLSRVPMSDGSEAVADRKVAPSMDFLAAERLEFKGFLASARPSGRAEAINEANIKVHVKMAQSDLPAGLLQLMTLMGESVGVRRVVPPPLGEGSDG
jgi:hypothetical protein